MKVLGITGGVGAGKSTVLAYLSKKYAARVVQADQVAHFLQEPGQTCYYRIIETFGSSILNGDQTISREQLAKAVFNNQENLKKLNNIIHPAVKEYIVKEIEAAGKKGKVPFFVIEAALLIEDRYDLICDEIWYIHAGKEVRKQRLMVSRGYSEEKAENIMKSQLSEEEFLTNSQFVVDNSGDFVDNTYEQIDRGLVEHEFL